MRKSYGNLRLLKYVFFIVLSALALAGCGKTTVKLDKYVSITAKGCNGYGQAVVGFDVDKFEKDYNEKIDMDATASTVSMITGASKALTLYEFCVDYELSKDDMLYNGDTVVLSWRNNDNAAMEYFNSQFKCSDITYTVEGLEDVKAINPFDYIDVSFDGMNGYGSVDFEENDQPEAQYIKFGFDDVYKNLSNGDVVRIVAEARDGLIRECGAELCTLEKEYEVSGLQELKVCDVFENISVEFSGLSGIGEANMKYDGKIPFLTINSFSFDNSNELSNGERVHVSVKFDELEAAMAGYKIDETSKEYIVSGLKEPERYSPYDDLTVEFAGFSGVGQVQLNYEGKKGMLSDKLISNRSFSCDKTNNLSNGDSVTVKFEMSSRNRELALSKYGYVVQSEIRSYKVEGLTEPKELNPFDNIEISFEGISPLVSAKLEYNETVDGLRKSNYSIDKTDFLKNGDEITVSVNDYDNEKLLENGYYIEKNTMKYKVEVPQSYINQFKELSEENLDELKSEAKDYIISDLAGKRDLSADNYRYEGYFLKTIKDYKDVNSSHACNNLYIVYSAEISSVNDKFSPIRGYFPMRFASVSIGDNGALDYVIRECYKGEGRQAEMRSRSDSYITSINGFLNPIVCYKEVISAFSDNYSSSCGDGIEKMADCVAFSKISDIPKEWYNELIEEAEDFVKAGMSSEPRVSQLDFSNTTMLGTYFLTSKSSNNYLEDNLFYVIFKTTISSPDGYFDDTEAYYAVKYTGLVPLPNGELMVKNKCGVVRSDYTRLNGVAVEHAYFEEKEMFNLIINERRSDYRYEVSGNMKDFG